MTLNHPGEDSHGTIMWLETHGNETETIVYQDTRGDQVCVCVCKCVWVFKWVQVNVSIIQWNKLCVLISEI